MNIGRFFIHSVIWIPFIYSLRNRASPLNMGENLGKSFEKAICLLYNTPFHGRSYQYNINAAEKLMERTRQLKEIYPDIKHVTDYSSKYDFIIENSHDKYLSAKTTRYRGKVCPQVIGQCTRNNFCNYFNITNRDILHIKEFIQCNTAMIIKKYFENTFLCPILYYNENLDKLSIIKLRQGILWEKYNLEFRHLQRNREWNGSTTLYIVDEFTETDIPIGEFQIHSNRDVIKFRWYFENLLEQFPEKFETIYI